ncbi:unannotated protein [freshwater metagenome]|uniref:Unannotated protein n=1 Tax=freshwater metagenome TaxID=449393 RepID=A0A6J7Q809_9ZZZZ
MTPARVVVVALALLGAVVLQLSLLSRLNLPGATPDLVLVVVMACGFVRGPVVGTVAGFAGGVLLDLAPPSLGYFGLTALLLAVAGYAAGVVDERSGGVVAIALVTVVCAALGSVLGRALLGSLLGDPRVVWGEVPADVVTGIVYSVLLAALVIPTLGAVDRFFEPRLSL